MEIDYLNNTLEMDYKGRKIILQVNAQDGEDFELDANLWGLRKNERIYNQ